MGGETRPLKKDSMDIITCKCGETYTEDDFNQFSAWLRCVCGEQVYKSGRVVPLINFNNWKPDYRQMDGEKEFTAAGGYE